METSPAATLPLDENDVDVWLTRLDTLEPHLRARYAQRLSAGEQERWQRFLAQGAADQYLIGRVLLRTTLSRYAAVAEEAWTFETNAYGCPFVAAPACHRDLRFNLSHTEGLVACAVTRGGEIGVDVENIQRVLDPLAIAPAVFAPTEIDDLAAVPPEERHRRFLAYWTLKEAYIKARGMGVSLPLDGFWFELDDGAPRLHFGDQCPDRAERWHVSRWQPTPNHDLALAIATPAGRAPRIRLRWILLTPPGVSATRESGKFRADGPPGSP
ncbi:MAG TPA: 4'-phosphopantetheinyl transferase superfamily protein [Stellaceae bacterium]|nr:4'-phosphopantetheinyl transferase superfamily protein [Stellaceae bacterium]